MEENNQLSASLEDYLETIYLIVQKKQAARAKDISIELKVKASSVTGALRQLSEKGLINYAPYDIITLTSEGEQVAQDVLKRHRALYDFFRNILGIDEQEAEKGACKLEHEVSPLILKRLKSFIDFFQQCPRAGTPWVKEFNSFCVHNTKDKDCKKCLNDCLKRLSK
jgi:DtxR family Mn-dependent transcriptional regulator